MASQGFINQLCAIVGPTHVLVEPDLRAGFETDWTGRFNGEAIAVVRPANAQEIQSVVQLCIAEKVAIVPQGGNTGLVGGSVPLQGGIVLSTKRLNAIGEITDMSLYVGAGVTLAAVQQKCADSGLRFPVDLAARDSATIGGMFATNASGLNHLRFGNMGENTVAADVVDGGGSFATNVSRSELCGAEGTLGVVTALKLRLQPMPTETIVMIASFATSKDAIMTASIWMQKTFVEALEFFTDEGLHLVCNAFSLSRPLTQSATYLLVEVASNVEAIDTLLSDITMVVDNVVATSTPEKAALWRYREDHTAAINTLGPPLKFDVQVPPQNIADFLLNVESAVNEVDSAARLIVFGHIADGHMHLNVVGAEFPEIEDAVYRCVLDHHGSVVSEHGVGNLKAEIFAAQLTTNEHRKFDLLKDEYDPHGIMNPGVFFDVRGR